MIIHLFRCQIKKIPMINSHVLNAAEAAMNLGHRCLSHLLSKIHLPKGQLTKKILYYHKRKQGRQLRFPTKFLMRLSLEMITTSIWSIGATLTIWLQLYLHVFISGQLQVLPLQNFMIMLRPMILLPLQHGQDLAGNTLQLAIIQVLCIYGIQRHRS